MNASEKTFDEFEELVLELDMARILFAEEEEEEEARIVVSIKDITERRRAENEIQALARFPSENPGPVLRIARDGTLLYVNAAGLSQLPDWHLQAGQNAPSMMRDVVSEVLNRGKARSLDLEECERVYSFFVAPIADAGYANLYGRDITERKRAEEALRESEELLNATQRLTKVGGWEWNVETQAMYWTEETYIIHDFVPGEMVPGSAEHIARSTECYDTEDRPVILAAFKRCVEEGQPYDFDFPFTTAKGRRLWIRTTAHPVLESGKVIRVIGNIMDITENKQAEEALRRSEENFRRSLDDSPLGVRIVTAEGETIYANRAILDINDCDSLEEMEATPVEKRYNPESFAEHQIRKEKRKRGDYDPSEYEISIVRKDGEVRHLHVFRKPTLWDGEEQFQVIYQDITERKRLEEGLLASREQMQALAGRLQEVREVERTDIAREIHDELGGALTGMKVDVSFLIKSALKIENEAARTSLLAGMDSVTKAIDTTIHAVRRIAMELRPGILDDLGLIAALEWQLKDFEKRTGIRCEFFPPGEDISLDANLSTALFRIFQEALTNVARHSAATEVRVRLRADADSTTLEVEDNGQGIEKEKILSKESLGLLGMRERAQIFGGRITVTGTPGTGTIVMVEIPPSSTTPLLAAGEFISLADLE